jgi:uncharacterized protein (DUF1330 family)
MRRLLAILALVALAARAEAAADVLDEYVALQVGSFTSEAQAKQDARYGVATWHFVEIWTGTGRGERWLYTESWLKDAPQPYMQRVTRLTAEPDGTITARRYSLPEPARYVGAWKEPARFGDMKPDALVEMAGCDLVLTRAGKGRFEGTTLGNRCRNAYKGASYAISRSTLSADGMTNWDRGFNVAGELVWGPAGGGYRFRHAGEQGACTQPVRMLVYGEIKDRAAFGAYAKALGASGLYPKVGGWYEAITPPIEVFEGNPPPGRGVIIARFPCADAARKFWHSPEYTEIRKLREGVASFEVLLLPVPPLPAYVQD